MKAGDGIIRHMKIKHCYVAKDPFDFLENHGGNIRNRIAYMGRLLPGSGGLNVLKFPDPIENKS